ncbi:hypothetical protein ABFS82_09G062300 [Erythranthe guttata]
MIILDITLFVVLTNSPCLYESFARAWWGIGDRRWRWPMIGKPRGVGGRLLEDRCLIRVRIIMVGISHMRKKMMYSSLYSRSGVIDLVNSH